MQPSLLCRTILCLTLTVGMFFSVTGASAATNPPSENAPICTLKNGSNAELKSYFSNLRKEIVAINQTISKKQCSSAKLGNKNIEEDLSNTTINNERAKANQLLSQTINEVRDLNLLYTNFAYNVTRIYK